MDRKIIAQNDDQEVSTLSVCEHNSIILRKGTSKLLSSKIMLYCMLKIENRNNKIFDPVKLIYYDKIKKETGVDYSQGLVAEIRVSELKSVLRKKNSGSFYTSLKELFSMNPYEEGSLRNNWAVLIQNPESNVLGYSEIITSCHYDSDAGIILAKFNDAFKDSLLELKSDYTNLPFYYMMQIKSVYTFRLFEILYCEMSKVDAELKENGISEEQTYVFRYSLGELQLMLGALNIMKDAEEVIGSSNPDYNQIAEKIQQTQKENLGNYSAFKRYSIQVAVDEINATDGPFTVEYSVEKSNTNKRKVDGIVFYLKKKTDRSEEESNSAKNNFILEIGKLLNEFVLSYEDLLQISEASNYDKAMIGTSAKLYKQLNTEESFVDWFLKITK